jgi:hypothetical protein
LFSSHFVLGLVRKFVIICYKLQDCESIHSHIILWLDKYDIDTVTNEIIAHVLTIINELTLNLWNPSITCNIDYSKYSPGNNCIHVHHGVNEK